MAALIQSIVSPETFSGLAQDAKVLYSNWLKPLPKGCTTEERLEAFYSDQAEACDHFRSRFLHGREPMLQRLADRLFAKYREWEAAPIRKGLMGKPKPKEEFGLIWVDMGGGTGANVEMMAKYIDMSVFRKIYVVDLTPSLVKVARARFEKLGWANVEVVHDDATTFTLPDGEVADAYSFSYSLSMMPPFHEAIDNALNQLKEGGVCAVADFGTSKKYDVPERQHNALSRVFWRAVFELDGINLSPEVRQYLEYRLDILEGSSGSGSIPYVPTLLKAPYYVTIGTKKTTEAVRGSD